VEFAAEAGAIKALALKTLRMSMHYERTALLSGIYRGDVWQESEEKIGKSAEE
jgi:hypothetical protein